MERIRTRFIIAVTERLASAADSTAKVELIEELSDNLYQRFQELLGSGVPEEMRRWDCPFLWHGCQSLLSATPMRKTDRKSR